MKIKKRFSVKDRIKEAHDLVNRLEAWVGNDGSASDEDMNAFNDENKKFLDLCKQDAKSYKRHRIIAFICASLSGLCTSAGLFAVEKAGGVTENHSEYAKYYWIGVALSAAGVTLATNAGCENTCAILSNIELDEHINEFTNEVNRLTSIS